MSSYAVPDTFGPPPTPQIVDPASGITYQLGFDDATSPPTPIWFSVGSWAAAELHWATWAIGTAEAADWGTATAVAAS